MILLALLAPVIAGVAAWFWASKRYQRNEPAVIAGAVALLVLVLVLAGAYWLRGRQLQASRAEMRTAALVRDSLETANDTLKRLNVELDSGRVAWSRRAFQAEVLQDDVDRELRTQQAANARLSAEVRRLEVRMASAVTIDSLRPDVRLVESTVYQAPFTVTIAGEVPPPPYEALFVVSVRVDPIQLDVAIRCGEPVPPAGIRPAHVTAEAPEWLTISDLLAQASPDVCNPVIPPPTWWEKVKIGAPYAAGGAAVGALAVVVLMVVR